MDELATLAIAFAPGVTVAKWTRIWAERHAQIPLTVTPVSQTDQVAVVMDGRASLSFVRLPIDSQGLHVIPLYRERTVVVAEKDHFIAAAEEVTLADLAGEKRQTASTDHADRGPFDLVAAGVGVLVVPQAIARQQSRKDVVVRPITDAAETQIALVWRADPAGDAVAELVEEFIGIVRGRTAGSSRAASASDGASSQKKLSAKERGAAKAGRAASNERAAKSDGASHAAKRKQAAARKKHRGR